MHLVLMLTCTTAVTFSFWLRGDSSVILLCFFVVLFLFGAGEAAGGGHPDGCGGWAALPAAAGRESVFLCLLRAACFFSPLSQLQLPWVLSVWLLALIAFCCVAVADVPVAALSGDGGGECTSLRSQQARHQHIFSCFCCAA